MISACKLYEDIANKVIYNPLLMSVAFSLPKYIKNTILWIFCKH